MSAPNPPAAAGRRPGPPPCPAPGPACGHVFHCPACGAGSAHPDDARYQWCGACGDVSTIGADLRADLYADLDAEADHWDRWGSMMRDDW